MLELLNETEGTREEYTLVGEGTQPKPSGRLVFNEAKCYKRHPGKILLPSLSARRRVRYSVWSSLPDVLDGPDFAITEPGEPAHYHFCLTPEKIGHQTGRIVFTGHEMRLENNPDYDSG